MSSNWIVDSLCFYLKNYKSNVSRLKRSTIPKVIHSKLFKWRKWLHKVSPSDFGKVSKLIQFFFLPFNKNWRILGFLRFRNQIVKTSFSLLAVWWKFSWTNSNVGFCQSKYFNSFWYHSLDFLVVSHWIIFMKIANLSCSVSSPLYWRCRLYCFALRLKN